MHLRVVWVVIIFALIGTVSGLIYINQKTETKGLLPEQKPQGDVIEDKREEFSEPQNLSIPKIGVDALIESVGEDAQGKMDVPKDVFNAGWYNLGFKPGEKGNAVLAGHLDTSSGAPAVFYNIGSLKPGDQVIVTDKKGKQITFEVTDVKTFAFDKVPLNEIFGPSDKPKLNLITCVGVWDIGTRNYSERLVVYTEQKIKLSQPY